MRWVEKVLKITSISIMYKTYYKECVLVSVMSVESMKNSQFTHIKKMIYETLNASMVMKDDIS